MWYFIIVIAIILIGFFVWTNIKDNKRKAKRDKKGDRPLFRTEEDLEEYGKSMESHPVDFEDAE